MIGQKFSKYSTVPHCNILLTAGDEDERIKGVDVMSAIRLPTQKQPRTVKANSCAVFLPSVVL